MLFFIAKEKNKLSIGDVAKRKKLGCNKILRCTETIFGRESYANIHLEPNQTNQFQWQVDIKRIEIFKTLTKPAEIKRFNKAIKLIPKDGVFHM